MRTKTSENSSLILFIHELQTIGNKEILKDPMLAIFCSKKCPPDIIVKSLDLAVEISKVGITVIGGFQTILEKEFLDILLKGKQNIIWYPARNIENYQYPGKFKKAVNDDRCLIISNFPTEDNRISLKRGIRRNYFIAEQDNAILILHAALESNTEKLSYSFYNSDKKLFTIKSKSNKYLLELENKEFQCPVSTLRN